jgi:hypothetical protein
MIVTRHERGTDYLLYEDNKVQIEFIKSVLTSTEIPYVQRGANGVVTFVVEKDHVAKFETAIGEWCYAGRHINSRI